MAEILEGGKRDNVYNDATGDLQFTVTNWTRDVAMDCDADADAAICDVLGTLIKILISKGIIHGTVSA